MDPREPRLLIEFSIAVLLLFSRTDRRACDALLLRCPIHQMHLQKVVGFRPSLDYLTEQNRIFAPETHPQRGRRDRYTIETLNEEVHRRHDEPTASRSCWRICSEDEDCIAYVHLLDTNECYGFSYFERTQRYRTIRSDLQLVADPEAIYFEKSCLKVPEMCKNRFWTLTKIPGTGLVYQGKKTIPTLVTRRECAEKCLFEGEFQCLSASFGPSYRNNRKRHDQLMALPQSRADTLGRCILSDKDKMIQGDAFRAAPFDEEYIENQCVDREMENESCSYELYSNSSFIYAEAKYMGLSQKECQSYCTRETKFLCLGVTFSMSPNDLSPSLCFLHSEDIISMGPRSLHLKIGSVYMRRVRCLNVQVVCSNEQMAIQYTPKDWFRGKMYVNAHSTDCMVAGNGSSSTVLRLPIGSEAKENRCGILRAYEVTKQSQRIFISALIVIQNNANVQTQGDRLIKVGCIINNSSESSSDDEGETVSKEEPDDVPNAIALESSLEFAQRVLPNEGSVLYNISDQQFVPKISLQIIDVTHQRETTDVQIGQLLELQIVAQAPHHLEPAAPALYDIRATSLVAKTQNSQNYVLLIDDRGCPTDITVFPALERVHSDTKNMLRSRFHAFKFAGTSLVSFDVKVHFCPYRCLDMNCLPRSGDVAWNTRNRMRSRRQIALQNDTVHIKAPVYISNVMDSISPRTTDPKMPHHVFNYSEPNVNREDFALPLNFSLHVRGPDVPNSNSSAYEERGILLIAGIDNPLHSEGIYINQSLLIALFIFWLCIQVALMFGCCYVTQKYKRLAKLENERRRIHESLEYLDGRRVHWADSQGGYTL